MMTAPMASAVFHPRGVPSRSPRTVSMIGVKGWSCANQCNQPGIEAVGTKPLPSRGSRVAMQADGKAHSEDKEDALQAIRPRLPTDPFAGGC